MSAQVVVGVDVGGTKTHVRAVPAAGAEPLVDVVVPTVGWDAVAADAAAWLATTLREALAGHAPGVVVVGAHGVETPAHERTLGELVAADLGVPVTIVNDAELVVPAAGLESGVGVIAGTGAIVVGRGPDGARLRAGGWGWVLSDDGSASALVRDAVVALLRADDQGRPDVLLRDALLTASGVADLGDLAHRLSWGGGTESWGELAPAVTRAAAHGSPLAAAALETGARGLAGYVRDLVGRGADGRDVVLAGGLLAALPEQRERVADAVRELVPGARVHHLAEPPVVGAVRLAQGVGPR